MKKKAAAPKPMVKRLFKNQAAWQAWLEKNHEDPEGLWLHFAKKGTGKRLSSASSRSGAPGASGRRSTARRPSGRSRAAAFFAKLNGANRYAVLWRIQTARTADARTKRIAEMIAMLKKEETFHPWTFK